MKKSLIFMMLALLFFSCNEKPKTLKPVSSKIEGPLVECFEVVDRDYPIIGNQVNIEFTKVNNCQMEPQFVAEFLDDVGNVIATSNVDLNSDQGMKFLLTNKVGESSTVAFTISNGSPTKVRIGSLIPSEENGEILEASLDTEMAPVDSVTEEIEAPVVMEEVVEEVAEVIEDEEEDEDDEDDEEETPAQSVRSSGSKDWDKILDDYESYVDQYIKLAKKASSGDMSAMTDYVLLLEKAERLEEELNKAKDDLSVAQSQRLLKIAKKISDAAMSM